MLTHGNGISNPLTLFVRGLSIRGLPFSLVCAHLQTETLGLRDQVVLNLDSMVDSHNSERSTGGDLLRKQKNPKVNKICFPDLHLHAWDN